MTQAGVNVTTELKVPVLLAACAGAVIMAAKAKAVTRASFFMMSFLVDVNGCDTKFVSRCTVTTRVTSCKPIKSQNQWIGVASSCFCGKNHGQAFWCGQAVRGVDERSGTFNFSWCCRNRMLQGAVQLRHFSPNFCREMLSILKVVALDIPSAAFYSALGNQVASSTPLISLCLAGTRR